jgi:mannose/fructose/N-acetylgalactosamine-specific phosphotransferase system component IIB
VKEFAETYSFHQGNGQKTIVLFSKISDALMAYRLGFRFDRLNIGNVYNEDCKRRCTPSVLLSDGDIRDLSSLREEGVQIDLQPVPREKPVDYFDVVQVT